MRTLQNEASLDFFLQGGQCLERLYMVIHTFQISEDVLQRPSEGAWVFVQWPSKHAAVSNVLP